VVFLTLDDILESHQNQIDTYGGSPGIRDVGLLESAIAQPEASFGGQQGFSTRRSRSSDC
jgi:death-on-curing protein